MDDLSDLLRKADRDRYLASLYAPEDRRGDLTALYAFNAEIAAVRERAREPLPGEVRLRWWLDALAAPAGQATGNPVADALRAGIARHGLPMRPFEDMVEARMFDLYDDPMPDRATLEGYCGETASALIQLSALILDPAAAAGAASAAGHAGCAQAIAGLLRLLPLHRSRGQCYVPAELLAAAGTSRDAFVSPQPGEAGVRAISAMIALARDHLARFEASARDLPKSLRPAFLPVAPAAAYLEAVEKLGERALTQVATISELRRNLILLNRAMRGW
jgi:phytoene synthase